ncbi:MAG: alpha-ketoglutarate-dependent dioxygenase AlkB [Pseudomonadota bacterium]
MTVPRFESIELAGGSLRWAPDAVDPEQADRWLAELTTEISWRSETLKMYGREVPVPRLIAWYGDPGTDYRYSGVNHAPLPWSPTLASLRRWLASACGHPFNSVLANLYRDGQDAMGWHADNERELGRQPVIASLSLGATRRMRFRRVDRSQQSFHLDLTHGSLLVMQGQTQQHWQHAITRTQRSVAPRINLTFRQISTADGFRPG